MEEPTKYSKALNIPEMVKLMKIVVPEFKSMNSRFAEYDSEEQAHQSDNHATD